MRFLGPILVIHNHCSLRRSGPAILRMTTNDEERQIQPAALDYGGAQTI